MTLGTITLTLRPMPSAIPVPIRLRALLKYALRGLSLRCVAVSGLPDGDKGADKATPDNATSGAGCGAWLNTAAECGCADVQGGWR